MSEIKVIELQVKTNLDNANSGLGRFKTGLKEVSKQAKETTQNVTGMSKVEGTINAIGDGVGKLNPAFGAAVKGANGLILKMWEMVANPIGAILAGIVITAKFLYEAFQNSVSGGKEIKTIFAALSAVGEQLKDALFGLGRALINVYVAAYKFITLDFKGAMENIKEANNEATESFKQLGNAVDGTTFKIIKNLEKQQQANDKARKVQAVVQSETNKLLVQSREILTDETASINAKKKALEEVTKAEKESSKEKVRIAAEDLRILKAKAAALGGESEKKMKGDIREATIALNEAETENAQTGIKLNKQRKMLLRQETEDRKAAIADKKAADAEEAAKKKEIYDADKAELEERLRQEGLSFAQRRQLVKDDLLLNEKDRKKLNDTIDKEERKATEDHNKAIADLNLKYDNEAKSAAAITAQEKLDLEMQNKLDEINLIAKTEKEKSDLYDKWNTEYDRKQKELNKNELLNQQSKNLTVANDSSLSFQTRLDAIKAREDAEKDIVFKSKDEQLAYEKANADATEKIEKEKAAARMAYLSAGSSALKNAANLAGEATDTGKALAVAAATIDTYQSAVSSYNSLSGIPMVGPVLGAVAAGVAVASGIANVKKILSVKTPKGGGGGAAPAPAAAPQFNVVGATGVNQLAGALSNREQQPVQAYVVANNVSTAQALDRNIIRSATLG
jgi:hypothetical protein